MPNDLSWRMPSPKYAWSQDYAALLDAMVEGAVMAVFLYDTFRDGTKLFDACLMMRRPISYKHVEFVASARGIEYFSARDVDEFKVLCEKYEAKFLDPRTATQGDCIHCGALVSNDDVDHWKTCPSHPANAEIYRLHAAIAASQLESGTQIYRQQRALTTSGIPAQAQGDPATTPPLRVSVRRAREIMEEISR